MGVQHTLGMGGQWAEVRDKCLWHATDFQVGLQQLTTSICKDFDKDFDIKSEL